MALLLARDPPSASLLSRSPSAGYRAANVTVPDSCCSALSSSDSFGRNFLSGHRAFSSRGSCRLSEGAVSSEETRVSSLSKRLGWTYDGCPSFRLSPCPVTAAFRPASAASSGRLSSGTTIWTAWFSCLSLLSCRFKVEQSSLRGFARLRCLLSKPLTILKGCAARVRVPTIFLRSRSCQISIDRFGISRASSLLPIRLSGSNPQNNPHIQ